MACVHLPSSGHGNTWTAAPLPPGPPLHFKGDTQMLQGGFGSKKGAPSYLVERIEGGDALLAIHHLVPLACMRHGALVYACASGVLLCMHAGGRAMQPMCPYLHPHLQHSLAVFESSLLCMMTWTCA